MIFPQAVEAYQAAVAIKPYLLKAQLGLVSSFTALRQSDSANVALERAFQINSHHKEVLSWRTKQRAK